MTEHELKTRTKRFAVRIMKLVNALPRSPAGRAVANQVVRSGTAVGANYRAACRARSRREFLSRLGVVEEETDETGYWLELVIEAGLLRRKLVESLLHEAEELTSIFAASIKTVRSRMRQEKSKIQNRKSKI